MATVRILQAPSFDVVGRKTWIGGQDNEAFGAFWQASHEDGLVDALRAMNDNKPGPVTGSHVFGVSCVERDPADRAFYFMIAAEHQGCGEVGTLECYTVPAATWAVFANEGTMPGALIEAEMYAFTQWLPASAYRHAYAPELEVYPAQRRDAVEFWLPIVPR